MNFFFMTSGPDQLKFSVKTFRVSILTFELLLAKMS